MWRPNLKLGTPESTKLSWASLHAAPVVSQGVQTKHVSWYHPQGNSVASMVLLLTFIVIKEDLMDNLCDPPKPL